MRYLIAGLIAFLLAASADGRTTQGTALPVKTEPGQPIEATIVGGVLSATVIEGVVDATLVDVPFSQTVHGRVTTTPDSQTGIIGEVGAALVSTIPGSRTNSVLASEELDNASYWGLANVTIQADATVGPDGIASADWVRETNANDYHTVQQLLTLLDDKPKAISFYAKKKERSVVYAMFYENAKSFPTALQFFDINAGTLGSTDQAFPGLRIRGAKIVPSSVSGEPGWWRCMMIVERLAGVTGYSIEFGVAETDGVPTYTGTTGYGAYITRAQVEDDEVTVGPYIKTTTVAVTEGSDLLGDVKAEVTLDSGAQNLTLGKQSDTQAAVGSWAPGIQAVRRDDPAGGAPSANNDWYLVQGDALGRLWVNLGAVHFSLSVQGSVVGGEQRGVTMGSRGIGIFGSNAKGTTDLGTRPAVVDAVSVADGFGFANTGNSGPWTTVGIPMLVVNGAAGAAARYARQSGTQFTSDEESGFAAHTKQVNPPTDAAWTRDSNLADTIHGGNILAPAGGETSFLLPCGTHWFKLRMYPGASATDALLVGGASGVNALPVMLSTPLDVYDLDVPVLGTTIWVAPSGGSVNGRYLYGVSQNPD